MDLSGRRTDWGEVRTWDPPDRLVLSWRVSAERTQEEPQNASEVEVQFTSLAAARTLVRVEHRAFERHGDGAQAMLEGMSSENGWSRILRTFADAASWPGTQDPANDTHQQL